MMNKIEFLSQLKNRISLLPPEDIDGHLNFYSEMIEDRKEDGISEEDAVAEIGSVDEIAEQIIGETPFSAVVKNHGKGKARSYNPILLICLSPLLAIAFALIFALYIILFSVIISLWAVFATFAICAVACFVWGIVLAFYNRPLSLASVGAGFLSGGFAILTFCGSKALTKFIFILIKKITVSPKKLFKKENA